MIIVPDFAWSRPIIWKNIVGILLLHVGAVAALFHFSWPALIVFFVLSFLTAQIGVSLGFHRLLCHSSYKAHRAVVRFFGLLGTLALQAGPITWVTVHRLHHQRADRDGDPHSPVAGHLWSYIIWTVFKQHEVYDENIRRRAARDLFKDPFMVFLDRRRLEINIAFALALYGIGFAFGGAEFGLALFLWGFCLRIVYGWHLAFFANMVTHICGYRNFDTPDNSRNIGWLFPLFWGDGLHNNHHDDPHSASYSTRWYELDALYWILCGLRRLGLVWELASRPRSG